MGLEAGFHDFFMDEMNTAEAYHPTDTMFILSILSFRKRVQN